MLTTLTVQAFRDAFPSFGGELFSDARVQFQLALAAKRLDVCRWDNIWQEGCFLHAAHHLTLEQEANKSTDGTGGFAAAAGPVTSISKSVGGVSLAESRAGAAATANVNAGHWNDSIYGKQYWQLAQLVGAGATVV